MIGSKEIKTVDQEEIVEVFISKLSNGEYISTCLKNKLKIEFQTLSHCMALWKY